MNFSITPEQQELIEKTRDRMARELRAWLLRPEALSIKRTKRENLIKFHSTLGRDIRNEFELWSPEHEITAIWHKWDEERARLTDTPRAFEVVIGDTIPVQLMSSKPPEPDNHPCHPDNFSFSVIERLWELYQERKEESL
jgi:hypothetical protein